ncbi:agmatinase family protein [Kordiimonas laminariae]|uniref:agmatinase family protein n=1 Tax=Kordiimonas laminariae TaxID=2917717 RepID=UPI001FF14362|nr:agmatinase family protein [Kordiimonas laminariae]
MFSALLRHVSVAALLLASTAVLAEDKEKELVDLPESLAAKVAHLPVEHVEFLRSTKALGFAGRHDILFTRLEKKDAEAIAAYVAAMVKVHELSKFNPETDSATVPLDPTYSGFNSWKVRKPAALRGAREPGPIDLSRYMYSGPKSGIPTFFNLPVAITPQDLVAGDVEVAIMGAPLDMGSGIRGAAYGPRAVRTGAIYKGNGPDVPEHMHTMVSPFNELTVVDYGDIAVDGLSTERSVGHIREMVREVAAAGTIPIIVGGDHSLMYPDVAGVVDVYGAGKVGVVHFDAHFDAQPTGSHLLSHGQPVHRLFSEEIVPGENFIQVGLRGYWPGKEGFEWMREHGLRYHTMAEVEEKGWKAVMDRVLEEALEGPEYIFISFDVDVLDPAYMPGTGTPEPGGLTTREAFPIVRRLCAEKQVVGFELVEVNPVADPGYTTAQNSDRILRECLTGIAMRKRGLTGKHYLSPLTVDHGQKLKSATQD